MVGGLAAGEVSTFQLTAGQNHYQVRCIMEEEAEDVRGGDDEDSEQEEGECDLLEHGLDPVDRLCLPACLTNSSTSGSKFCCLQCRWKVH